MTHISVITYHTPHSFYLIDFQLNIDFPSKLCVSTVKSPSINEKEKGKVNKIYYVIAVYSFLVHYNFITCSNYWSFGSVLAVFTCPWRTVISITCSSLFLVSVLVPCNIRCLLALQLTYVLFFVTTTIVLVFFVPHIKLVYLALSFSLVYSRYPSVPMLWSLMCFVSLPVGPTINY